MAVMTSLDVLPVMLPVTLPEKLDALIETLLALPAKVGVN
jgi:hypothetical protein